MYLPISTAFPARTLSRSAVLRALPTGKTSIRVSRASACCLSCTRGVRPEAAAHLASIQIAPRTLCSHLVTRFPRFRRLCMCTRIRIFPAAPTPANAFPPTVARRRGCTGRVFHFWKRRLSPENASPGSLADGEKRNGARRTANYHGERTRQPLVTRRQNTEHKVKLENYARSRN